MRWVFFALAAVLLSGPAAADDNQRSLEAAERIRKEYEAQELKAYGRLLTPEERLQKLNAAVAGKQGAQAGNCQPTLPVAGVGASIRIEPGQEERFGHPPGLYVVQGPQGLCSLVVSDQEAKDGDKWPEARRKSYAEWKTKRDQIHGAVLRSPVAGPKKCAAPLQQFGPASFITVANGGLQKQWGLGPGWYVMDTACNAVFAGPLEVAERGQRPVDKARQEAGNKAQMERWVAIAAPVLVILIVLLILHFVIKRFTSHGLLAWLSGKAGKAARR